MENRRSPELVLSLLLIAALCLEANIHTFVYYFDGPKNWTEARQYCQREHIDLATLEVVDGDTWLADWLLHNIDVMQYVWFGLRRDSELNSPWKWINLITGEGTAGDDLSQSVSWGGGGQGHVCAVVDKDLMWHSVSCSSQYSFFCSDGNQVEYLTDKLTWSDASRFCQTRDAELVTVTQENTHALTESGWIGLHQDSEKTWTWAGKNTSNYRNWAPGEPLNDDCGAFNSLTGRWYSNLCSAKLPFICYDDNLVVVKKNKTWEAALQYCRKMRRPCNNSTGSCTKYDLLSLTDMSDYNYVRDRIHRATTDEVWLGLRFLGGEWWWLNRKKAGQQDILPDCPSDGRHCGTMSKHDTSNWIIRDCSEKRNFICYIKSK